MVKRKAEQGAAQAVAKQTKTTALAKTISLAASPSRAQLSWASVWSMYQDKADKYATEGQKNCQADSVYDLVCAATREKSDVSAVVALALAKAMYGSLTREEQLASPQLTAQWRWSPQSTAASKKLAERCGDDPSAADVNNVQGDFTKSWAAGWRWYPEPAPKTKSHTHRFYPPSQELEEVAIWRCAAEKKERKGKRGPDAGCTWLSSPELKMYLAPKTATRARPAPDAA